MWIFFEEKKKDCLKMIPAPLFPSSLLSRSPFLFFVRWGEFSKIRYLGGEKCVAEVYVLFIEVGGFMDDVTGFAGFALV